MTSQRVNYRVSYRPATDITHTWKCWKFFTASWKAASLTLCLQPSANRGEKMTLEGFFFSAWASFALCDITKDWWPVLLTDQRHHTNIIMLQIFIFHIPDSSDFSSLFAAICKKHNRNWHHDVCFLACALVPLCDITKGNQQYCCQP